MPDCGITNIGVSMKTEHMIVSKRQLSEEVYRIEVLAPLVARERKAGQFVVVMYDEDTAYHSGCRS